MTRQSQKRFCLSTGNSWIYKFLSTIIALSLLTAAVFSQTDQARIAGSVRDQTNAVIQGATITVKNNRTGDTRTVTSNQEGGFLVTNLKPSTYTITVSAQNFANTEFTFVE